MLSRVDGGSFASWWWTIERSILFFCFLLICLGILLSFAASPSVALRIGKVDIYGFVKNQILFAFPAMFLIISISFLSPLQIRYFCSVLLSWSLLLLVAVLFWGTQVKGASRWLDVFGMSLQPSEFMKPGFIVLCALFFSEQQKDFRIFGFMASIVIFALCALLLILEPDIGQTMLLSFVWLILLVFSGIALKIVFIFGLLIAFGAVAAYLFVHHVHERINDFLIGGGNSFQVDMAREALLSGGWFGRGPGEGVIKFNIPDSHTDFVFSVAAEEYGIFLCLLIVFLFAFIVLRCLSIALKEKDPFIRFSIVGLASLLGLQSLINMAVNLHLIPPKGMTLPFISYGGSSLMSSAITMGLLLSLTRRRPEGRLTISAAPNYPENQ